MAFCPVTLGMNEAAVVALLMGGGSHCGLVRVVPLRSEGPGGGGVVLNNVVVVSEEAAAPASRLQ